MKKNPNLLSFSEKLKLTARGPVLDMEILEKEGRPYLPPMSDYFPEKVSVLDTGGVAVQNNIGNICVFAPIAYNHYGWNDFEFPELDKDLFEKINKAYNEFYSKQELK